MRAIFFLNQYLAGIHCGIQAGHAINQMWSEYFEAFNAIKTGPTPQSARRRREDTFNLLREFSSNHKTFVLLNGGDHDALLTLWSFLGSSHNTCPFSIVYEPGLNDAATCVVIILPERLYDNRSRKCGQIMAAGDVTKKDGTVVPAAEMADPDNLYTEWEREFLKRKSRCRLAQ